MTTGSTLTTKSMTIEEYHAADGVSKSDLDLIHRSPAHYQLAQMFPEEPTPAMLWGSMFHSLVLQPDVFDSTYAVMPEGVDRRTKEGKQEWEDWQSENADKTPIAKPTLEELLAMRDSIFSCERAKAALTGGVAEQSLFADWVPGITMKSRPDYVSDGLIVDLKTCVDARPDAFSKACWNYRYHVQAGYYSRVYEAVHGSEPRGFLFIAIEKTPPYAVALYLADDGMTRQGWHEAQGDLEVYRECVDLDIWPAYPDLVQTITLPVWAQDERP